MTISVNDIDAVLPQTQCGECGYGGCLPYANAITNEQAAINLCPPGGTRTLQRLATLMQKSADNYLRDFTPKLPSIAVIDEALCIGCTKCIQACPVDAIIGAAKVMHTVITDQCTGCNLCVEPCPMDCITMQVIPNVDDGTQDRKANQARQHFQARNTRLIQLKQQQQQTHQQAKLIHPRDTIDKKSAIAEAIARAKAKRDAA